MSLTIVEPGGLDSNTVGTNQLQANSVTSAKIDNSVILAVLQVVYPIGSYYINETSSTNPNTLFGFGTWVAACLGRTPVGVGTGTDINSFSKTFAAASTGGEYQHTQQVGELASHSHDAAQIAVASGNNYDVLQGSAFGSDSGSHTFNTGSNTPMQWMQPYQTAYIWKRTA